MEEKNKKNEEFNGFEDILFDDDFEEDESDETKDDDSDENEDETEGKDKKDTKSDSAEDDEVEDDNAEDEPSQEDLEKQKAKERNAEFARRRREREAKERAKREAEEARIKAEATKEAELNANKVNTYTDEPIKDEADLEVFKLMKEIDDQGGDPINDLPRHIAQRNRDKIRKEKEETEKANARTKKIQDETSELVAAYPDLDTSELAEDKEYIKLCTEKGDRWTMLEIYEYLQVKREKSANDAKKKAKDKALDKKAKTLNKSPSSDKNGNASDEHDYLNMTEEEFRNVTKHDADFF